MNIYGTLDSLLEYGFREQRNYPTDEQNGSANAQPNSLESLLQEKVDSLRTILGQVWKDISSRAAVSADVTKNIEQQYCYLKTKLFETYSWEFGRNRNIEVRRGTLEKQLDKLNEERRKEQVENWRDVAKLKEEFRKWFKQYCDLVQRANLLVAGSAASKEGIAFGK